jgi:putative inorganic carbon (HCO3(-)) transporter
MRPLMRLWYHTLLLVTPFVFTAINDELFEFNKMMLVYALTAAVAVTWAVWSIRARKLIWRNHALLPFAAVFLLSQIAATVFSIHIPTSIYGYYSRFHGGLLSTVSYLVLFQAAVSTLQKSDVRALVRTALIATLGICLYAIPEHFGVSPSCILITQQANATCWVQDVQNRVFATFGQPNWLAAYLLVIIPIGVWYWVEGLKELRKQSWLQWWPLVTVALSVTTLVFTKSRSGEFGLFVGMMVFVGALAVRALILHSKKDKLSDLFVRKWKIWAAGAVALVLPLFLFGYFAWSGLENKLFGTATRSVSAPVVSTGTQLESGGTDSGKIRMIVWKGALKVWQRSPLFGSGVETFAYSYYQDRPREHNDISEWDFLYNKAHNEFLNFLATTGVFGLGSYLAFLGTFAYLLISTGIFKRQKTSEHDQNITLAAAALMAASAGLAVSNFFGFSTVMVGVWFFVMPALWLLLTLPRDTETDSNLPVWEQLSTIQWGAITVVCLAGLWALWGVTQTWNNDRVLAISKAALNASQAELAYSTSLQLTTKAPNEALFWEQRALVMARLAMTIGEQDATTAAQLANDADISSQTMLQLNPRHVNLWKSRVRVLLFLAVFDDSFLADAEETLIKARTIAPTDSKLTYNLALVAESMGKNEDAIEWYRQTLELRPGYTDAALSLKQLEDRLSAEATVSAQPASPTQR